MKLLIGIHTTTLNACPQLADFNRKVWLDLEYRTQEWADEFGKIWVICGPVFDSNKEVVLIGDDGEKLIAIPHAFFKIIIRETGDQIQTLAFMYPHKKIEKVGGKYPHEDYLVMIDKVESMTGLDFLTRLPDEQESQVERKKAESMW